MSFRIELLKLRRTNSPGSRQEIPYVLQPRTDCRLSPTREIRSPLHGSGRKRLSHTYVGPPLRPLSGVSADPLVISGPMVRRNPDSACPLCNDTECQRLVIPYDRQHPREGDFSYVQCAGCGLGRANPLPRPEQLPQFYPEDYGCHAHARDFSLNRWINRMAARYLYSTSASSQPAQLREICRLLSGRIMKGTHLPRGQNRMLDVGCGSGDLLEKYATLGWSVKGIEVSPLGAKVARERGLEIHCGTVLDAPFELGSFDLVLLNHVIEHLLDPVGTLVGAARFLKRGGTIIVRTPNLGGVGFLKFGSAWYSLDAPRHICLFSLETAKLLGERAGLRTNRIETHHSPRVLCRSRHYLETQGATMPPGFAARRRLIEERPYDSAKYRWYRRRMRLSARKVERESRGDELEIEYSHPV